MASVSFEAILEEVERSGDATPRPAAVAGSLGHPFATFAGPSASSAAQDAGPIDRWDLALEWIAEPADAQSARRPARILSDSPDAIAAELGLARVMTRDQLKRARRRFMWENHPDRQGDAPRELANRRVAIANMLIDRAEAALRKDGAP